MIPAALFDHRATVWRYRELRGSSFREKTRQWKRVSTARRMGLFLKVNREARDDTGAGERTTGEYSGTCNAHVDVQGGDVLEVYYGRHAPLNLKVEEHDAPGGQTAALVMVPFVGELAS